MRGALWCQKHRETQKGMTREPIGPRHLRTVPDNVLMVSGSDRSHWKLYQVVLSLHAASVRVPDRGMRPRTGAA